MAYYAIIDSALRRARGLVVDEHRDQLAQLYSRFSEIAADNPHAWSRDIVAPDHIRNHSKGNSMLAFPYTKLHNSQWNIDQGSALLLCSAEKAEALGVPRDRWVLPQVFTEANDIVNITARDDLDRCVGAEVAGRDMAEGRLSHRRQGGRSWFVVEHGQLTDERAFDRKVEQRRMEIV